jgi:ABC-type nitrate/sulfonate/bicarbonate transport system ATPase subunit
LQIKVELSYLYDMKLDIQNLHFGYNSEKLILDGISLSVESNKTIAIVGASGCGKSTFLRLLCGIIKKTKANVLDGHISIDGISPEQFTEKGEVGFMFQEATLFPNLNVRENIALPLKFVKKKNEELVDLVINTVGLSKYVNYLPSELSGGMKTRVALARTFVTKPSLLLLDEPFSSLDIRWKYLLYEELDALRKSYNPMIVLVTHDIQEALLLSNHILVFGKGGKVLKQIVIEKPALSVNELNIFEKRQVEYEEIQNLILNDGIITLEENSI